MIYDFAIIGAGIAGASIASEIAGDASVLILEAEDHPGYHATGRSAAFWTESYGGPLVQPLTSASREFLAAPPPAFSERPLLKLRGALNIARRNEHDLAKKLVDDFAGSGVAMELWDRAKIQQAAPELRDDWTHAVYEPDCCDIDVAALHAAYLADAKRQGALLKTRIPVTALENTKDGWGIAAGAFNYRARVVINAAGAWASNVAKLARGQDISIQAMRRTMVQIKTDPPSRPDMPLIVALDGNFYFKPETGGNFWISPHDETPVAAGDAAPEEIDVALAIERFENSLTCRVAAVTRKWAGLRSFTPDRLPVTGFDGQANGFFWFAGQGGVGIQTAPAAARLAASQLLDSDPHPSLSKVDAAIYDPGRFIVNRDDDLHP